jgi:hypothetical protein
LSPFVRSAPAALSFLLVFLTGSIALAGAPQATVPRGGDAARNKKGVPPPAPALVEVAQIAFAEGVVEVSRGESAWRAAAERESLSVGDRVRTTLGATARLEFPWTAVSLGDNSEISLERSTVLTVRLDRGRLDLDPEQDLMKIVTGEATVSGRGRTVVRREPGSTFVSSAAGGADVEGMGQTVRLGLAKAVVVNAGAAPSEPMPLAEGPNVVSPAADPRYVRPGEMVRLEWKGRQPGYHLQVLSVDSDVPVIAIDLKGTSYDLRVNWLGTFRWRVAGRTGPIETQLSGEGLLCIVEK